MSDFDQYIVKERENSYGFVTIYKFPNGYGASVVDTMYNVYRKPDEYSISKDVRYFEMAVLDQKGDITYDTHITNDTLKYLDARDVIRNLIEVKDLIEPIPTLPRFITP